MLTGLYAAFVCAQTLCVDSMHKIYTGRACETIFRNSSRNLICIVPVELWTSTLASFGRANIGYEPAKDTYK